MKLRFLKCSTGVCGDLVGWGIHLAHVEISQNSVVIIAEVTVAIPQLTFRAQQSVQIKRRKLIISTSIHR